MKNKHFIAYLNIKGGKRISRHYKDVSIFRLKPLTLTRLVNIKNCYHYNDTIVNMIMKRFLKEIESLPQIPSQIPKRRTSNTNVVELRYRVSHET